LAFNDINANDGNIGFGMIISKIDEFTTNVLSHTESKYLGQKCGMDDVDVMAVDLRGNVMTCQNVSPLEIAKNGESHFGGTLDDIENITLKSATHWMNRAGCASCPVLHICKGSCMFLDDKYWEVSCNNAYSDAIALFALSFQKMTGYVPVLIKNDKLPKDRQDIWGTMLQHEEKTKKKIIPIKVVSEVIGKIDDVEVYGKSKVEA
jgi:uncharacterized protein